MAKKRIAIFGGGVAGLTVAHECIEKGLQVDVYEKNDRCGGKAVGYLGSDNLYIEHSIRVYSANYFSLFETFRRIPYQDKTIFDNLIAVEEAVVLSCCLKPQASSLKPQASSLKPEVISLRFRDSRLKKLRALLQTFKHWGLSFRERIFFLSLIIRYLFFSEARRRAVLMTCSFKDYACLAKHSEPFEDFITSWICCVVTAKPHATAEAVLELLCRSMSGGNFFNQNVISTYCVMNGPTSEKFIDPWIEQLKKLGVQFHLNSSLTHLEFHGNEVKAAKLENGSAIEADEYVLSLPYTTLVRTVPELKLSPRINQEWSFGFQFYLDVPIHSHCQQLFLVIDSPWKILYQIQNTDFWPGVTFPPPIQTIVSGAVTNIFNPAPLSKKPLFQCSPEELQKEILAQMPLIDPHSVVRFHVSPQLRYVSEEDYQKEFVRDWEALPVNSYGYRWVNESNLYIPTPEDAAKVPPHTTPFKNLWLAGEFVQTPFQIRTPTMEKANQSGKVCAEAIFEKWDIPFTPLKVPEYSLSWVRKIDSFLYRLFH